MEKHNLRAMSTRVYLFTLLCCLSLGAATAIAETKPKKSPKPPPGYASRLAIMAAFGSSKLELIDQNAPLPDGVVLEKDIEYGNANGHPLQLDLYRPANLNGPVPALLFIHGGGWKGGKRRLDAAGHRAPAGVPGAGLFRTASRSGRKGCVKCRHESRGAAGGGGEFGCFTSLHEQRFF